jgi:hypothetical protein
MDADRRRKTVIAGTFAIVCKSLSNAQPISADESQRTGAEMTMASMHVPTLHEAPRRRTFTRALSQDLQHSWKERRALGRPHAREIGSRGWVALVSGSLAQDEGGRKNEIGGAR